MSRQLLIEHVFQPLNKVVLQRLAACFYHDVVGIEALTTNEQGIDIIAQQVELVFEDEQSVFVGWDGVQGWPQYTLSASAASFCQSSERFKPDTVFWQSLLGKQLTSFNVFGFPDTRPHLLLLHFEEMEVAIANCYLAFDFIPEDPSGDDVWVLSTVESIHQFIEKLDLKKLEV
ncbi:hypothetical protein [Hymenobacter perfusus]|uniref:Uncharacterized protein n=1 Tax=Hymenobacter perfusus TaxID=1236770 RepID=A0A3R9NXS1_9BACT|nr:hypothetical protein [Hymenobacter perfusus]RSK44241.1 hypothetical protein EI293_06790 [Hymenobacter perfusus]